MNVTTEDLCKIRPGEIKSFLCEDSDKMQSIATLLGQIKRRGCRNGRDANRVYMPDGVVDYEIKRDFEQSIIMIHALREGEQKIFKRQKKSLT